MLAASLVTVLVGCGYRKRLDLGRTTHVDEDGPSNTSFEYTSQPPTSSPEPTHASEPDASMATPNRPSAVRGRLIDFWGHPVANVELDVGGVRAVTAPDGTFEVDGVPEIYDVSLVVHLDEEARETYGWTYQGLTDRTVTLPVYRGLPPRRATLRVDLPAADGGTLPCGALALDGKHGHQAFAIFQASTPVSVVWRGSISNSMHARALFWQPATAGSCASPLRFLGWQDQVIALDAGRQASLAFDALSESRLVATTDIQGSVRHAGEGAVAVSLFVRFGDGASVPVAVSEFTNPSTFSFAAPIIEETTLVVAASRSGIGANHYAVDYRAALIDQSAPDRPPLELRPPAAPLLTEPPAAARVSRAGARFGWDYEAGVAILVVTQESAFTTQFVVTNSNTVQLPDLSHLGLVLAAEVRHSWGVEFHGAAGTVDEWLRRAFPLDPFSVDFDSPVGPGGPSGAFARSEGRSLVFTQE